MDLNTKYLNIQSNIHVNFLHIILDRNYFHLNMYQSYSCNKFYHLQLQLLNIFHHHNLYLLDYQVQCTILNHLYNILYNMQNRMINQFNILLFDLQSSIPIQNLHHLLYIMIHIIFRQYYIKYMDIIHLFHHIYHLSYINLQFLQNYNNIYMYYYKLYQLYQMVRHNYLCNVLYIVFMFQLLFYNFHHMTLYIHYYHLRR